MRAFESRRIAADLVHTGQHYDEVMSEIFFRDLGIRKPDINLGAGGGSQAEQTAAVMVAYEKYLLDKKPEWTIVVGDVNSTLACALAAAKCNSKVCHVEAGLRSRDWGMPEEINRVLTDRLSSLLLTPSPDAEGNLLAEGIEKERIVCVGNVMIDTLFHFLPTARSSNVAEKLGVNGRDYILVTLHRPSNVDSAEALENAVEILESLSGILPVVVPVHPRTRKMLAAYGLDSRLEGNAKIIVSNPLGYIDFLALTVNSRFVITDSGGLQEETAVLDIPCLTMRENTERPITIEQGTNELVGSSKEKVMECAARIMEGKWKKRQTLSLWDGKAAERIADIFAGL